MRIRTKWTLSIGLLFVCFVLCMVGVTLVQFYIARDVAYFQDRETFASLQHEYERFYEEHGGSWNGLHAEGIEGSGAFIETALLVGGDIVARKGHLSAGAMMRDGFPLPLHASDGQEVGVLFVMNESQYKTHEFKTMWAGLFPRVLLISFVLVGVVALAVLLFLSWRLTRPIRQITEGIHAIKSGKQEVSFPVQRKDEFGVISRALHEMNESLAQMERSRKQLLSDVAHELKTPLMIMQGELELAQELGRPLAPEKLLSLQDEVIRLSRLVLDVLDLSKLEQGETVLRATEEDIVGLVASILEKTEFLAEEKGIVVELQAAEEELYVPIEKPRILQAIYNLLVNALHYTEPGGHVKVRIDRVFREESGKDYARICIEDDGIGIAAEELPYLFDRFYRVDESRSRPSGGTGLGLTIVRQNVSLHQGLVEVESQAGEGSRFVVWLPV